MNPTPRRPPKAPQATLVLHLLSPAAACLTLTGPVFKQLLCSDCVMWQGRAAERLWCVCVRAEHSAREVPCLFVSLCMSSWLWGGGSRVTMHVCLAAVVGSHVTMHVSVLLQLLARVQQCMCLCCCTSWLACNGARVCCGAVVGSRAAMHVIMSFQ